MPMNFSQLGALVDRAKQKPLPAVASPPPKPAPRPVQPPKVAEPTSRPTPAKLPQRAAQPRKAAPRSQLPPAPTKPSQQPVRMRKAASAPLTAKPAVSVDSMPPAVAPKLAPPQEPVPEADDFPTGWELSKESWYFHRRFFRLFRRPMHRGEYSHLLYQIRHRRAELLADNCWRVRLPDGKTLVVRGDRWRLANILPRGWQPPTTISAG